MEEEVEMKEEVEMEEVGGSVRAGHPDPQKGRQSNPLLD
jgi:hypothetical protein